MEANFSLFTVTKSFLFISSSVCGGVKIENSNSGEWENISSVGQVAQKSKKKKSIILGQKTVRKKDSILRGDLTCSDWLVLWWEVALLQMVYGPYNTKVN